MEKNKGIGQEDLDLAVIPLDYDWEDFRKNAYKTIDFIVDYRQQLNERKLSVLSSVNPGDIRRALSPSAPEEPQEWDLIIKDIEQIIVPGMTHWQHPDFYAYFPSLCAPSALLGDLMANAMNQPGFTWACSPAATELELHVMDWLQKAFNLPADKFSWAGTGGGIIQPSATEGMIISMLSARSKKPSQPNNLVCYYSDQAHFCVEKACKIVGVINRKIKSVYNKLNGNYSINLKILVETIEIDTKNGKIPFFISANFGATGVCAIDDLKAIGKIARTYSCWFNCDAAYAGVCAIVPEMRSMMDGVEECDSILINGSKWFNLMFNASFMFFKEKGCVVSSLNATGVYLDNDQTTKKNVHDLKDYQLGLGRPFRSLKVFCTIRSMGLQGFRNVILRHISLAQYLAKELSKTEKIVIVRKVDFGLVCFRIKDSTDKQNMLLLEGLNKLEGIHLVHTVTAYHGVVLRISLAHPELKTKDMDILVEKILRSIT
jgi:glutamate/tyrosine decarboxylase-like PLP-dependent enzyme